MTDEEWLLPTPATTHRASRRALLGPKFGKSERIHWTMPGLEQVLEMLQGILPREFHSWDEVKGRYRELGPRQ
jgi:hypothetical protein